jgi:hypothetical protein
MHRHRSGTQAARTGAAAGHILLFVGRQALDPRLVEAIGALDAAGCSYAEIRRAVRSLARRIAVPQPAYTTIRRIAITERTIADAKTEAWERIAAKLLQGRVPTPLELERLREAQRYSELARALTS